MKVKIRDCKIKDISRVIEIKKRALGPIWERADIKYKKESLREFIQRRFATDRIIVAVRSSGKKVIGFLHSTTYTDSVSSNKVREILTIAVDPEHRNKGIGSRLMEEEKNDAEEDDVDLLRLEVLSENEEAIDFYKKHGYFEKKKVMIQRLGSEK